MGGERIDLNISFLPLKESDKYGGLCLTLSPFPSLVKISTHSHALIFVMYSKYYPL